MGSKMQCYRGGSIQIRLKTNEEIWYSGVLQKCVRIGTW